MSTNIEVTTRARLESYSPEFNGSVLYTVSQVAARQATFTAYQDFFDSVGVPDGFTDQKNHPLLDIRPVHDDYDEYSAIVMGLPMANPLDANQVYQIATVAAANPTRRIVALANPSGPGCNANRLDANRRRLVSSGDASWIAEPLLQHLEEERIEHIDVYGYSMAAKTLGAILMQSELPASAAVVVEPVNTVPHTLTSLGRRFNASAQALDGYVGASDLPTFNEARADSVGPASYIVGLLRRTNLAVASALTHGDFVADMAVAALKHPETYVTVAWGGASELADDQATSLAVGSLQDIFGKDQFSGLRLAGQKHALANDIHLQAAILLQGLQNSQTYGYR